MAVIGIRYNEGKHRTYKAFKYKGVTLSGDKKKVFNSGDFIKDWFEVNKLVITGNIDEIVCHSSSVNHFIMDGAPFSSAYLHMVDDKPVLLYMDPANDNWSEDYIFEKGIEFFVKEGEKPTWEELKKYCEESLVV